MRRKKSSTNNLKKRRISVFFCFVLWSFNTFLYYTRREKMRDRRDASPCVYSSSSYIFLKKKRSTGGLEILRVFSTFDEIFRDIFYFIFLGRILSILLGADNMFQLRVERSLLEIGYAFIVPLLVEHFCWKTPGGLALLCYLTWRFFFLFWSYTVNLSDFILVK